MLLGTVLRPLQLHSIAGSTAELGRVFSMIVRLKYWSKSWPFKHIE
jgi:hypothetical protein